MSDFELIENYLSDKLSDEEKRKFRNRLLNDPTFNQEFQDLKNIRLQVKQKARQDIKKLFEGIESSIEQETTTKNQTIMKKVISIAASLVLIASLAYLGFVDRNELSSEQLYEKHYTSYNNLLGQVRGDSEEELSQEELALLAFETGDYSKSEDLLSSLVIDAPTAMNYFYLGLSQLETNNAEGAVASFNTVINNFDAFKDQARWYMALAHLKNNNDDSALSTLAGLIVKETEYEQRAKEVLEDYGVDLDDDDIDDGEIYGFVERRPRGTLSPDGSMDDIDSKGKRKFQWGKVKASDGEITRFITDEPIDNLYDGDRVIFVTIDRRGRGNGNTRNLVYVIDKN